MFCFQFLSWARLHLMNRWMERWMDCLMDEEREQICQFSFSSSQSSSHLRMWLLVRKVFRTFIPLSPRLATTMCSFIKWGGGEYQNKVADESYSLVNTKLLNTFSRLLFTSIHSSALQILLDWELTHFFIICTPVFFFLWI